MGICDEVRKKKVNEIDFEVAIPSEDVNKKIYFLDNTEFTDPKTKKQHNHDFLTELNEKNTKLYINNKEEKYKKFFFPEQKGIYRFKLVFSKKLVNCSYMFYNCKNLLKIDFSNFNSDNVKDISYMFYCCTNLLDIKFANFNTINVTNMGCIFKGCKTLKKSKVFTKDKNILKLL